MDNYFEIDEPKKKKGFTVGKLFKWIIVLLIVIIYAVLVARCTLYGNDKIVSKILTNETTLAAYHAAPDAFTVEQYGMNNSWVAVSDGRMVEFNNLYYLPAARQLQVAVKYNVDIAPYNGEDGIPFRFRLIDEENNVCESYFFEQKQKSRYNYIRVCFEGIALEKADAEPLENGKQPRKKYTLYIDRLSQDGSYTELCKCLIYDGSDIAKNIPFSA